MKLIVSLIVISQLGLALSQEDGARGGDLSEFSKYRIRIIIIFLSKTTYTPVILWKSIDHLSYKEIIILHVFSAFDCRKDGEPNGFFPDPEQCDLYYECVDGVATPTLCPDGLMFDDRSSIEAKCDYPFNTDCGVREYVRK